LSGALVCQAGCDPDRGAGGFCQYFDIASVSPLSFLEEEKRFGLWDQREECVCVYMSACVRALSLSTSETVIRFSKKFDMGNIKLEANRYL
jgi:hypothetical protein